MPEGPRHGRPEPAQLIRDFFRPSKGQLVAALILFITALALTWTWRSQQRQPEFANARQADLVQLLDTVTSQNRALETELRDLQSTRDELLSGADKAETVRADTEQRLEQLRILAGTVPAHGPGVRLTLNDPQGKISAELLLNAVEELRDAGAEVIELDDEVRVVLETAFTTDDEGRILAGGKVLAPPYVIDVIGDPTTLESGARFRGGLVSEVEGARVQGSVIIEQSEDIRIDSVVPVRAPTFARPR